jgi:hypothetical protein
MVLYDSTHLAVHAKRPPVLLSVLAKFASDKTQFREEEEEALKQVRLVAGLNADLSPVNSCSLQGKMVAG